MKRTSTPANPPPNPSDEIFNVSTLAHYLHCHPSTLYRLLKDKKIPPSIWASDWRFGGAVVTSKLFEAAKRGEHPGDNLLAQGAGRMAETQIRSDLVG